MSCSHHPVQMEVPLIGLSSEEENELSSFCVLLLYRFCNIDLFTFLAELHFLK